MISHSVLIESGRASEIIVVVLRIDFGLRKPYVSECWCLSVDWDVIRRTSDDVHAYGLPLCGASHGKYSS